MDSTDLKNVTRNLSNPRATVAIEQAIVRRGDTGEGFTCSAGARRLRPALAVHGYAEARVAETGEVLQVREVDGVLIAVAP